MILSVFAVQCGTIPESAQQAVEADWRISQSRLEEDGSAILDVRIRRAIGDTLVLTPHWTTTTDSDWAIDPSRIVIPSVLLPPGKRQVSVPIALPRDQVKQIDTDVVLTLASSDPRVELILVGLDRVQLMDVAPDSILSLGMEKVFQQDSVFQALDKHRRLHFPWLQLPAWTMPLDPDWTEDPYNDNAWQVFYQSLAWIVAYGRGWEITGDSEHLDEMEALIIDYMASNTLPDTTTGRPALVLVDSDLPEQTNWSPLTVTFRTETLCYIYRKYLADRLDQLENERLLAYVIYHGSMLRRYLDNDIGVGHNHAFMAARALLKLTHAFPGLTAETDWRVVANRRILELVGEMSDADSGVSTEQSMYYHYFAMELFKQAEQVLSRLHEPLSMDLTGHLEKMLAFAAITMYPDGTAPAFGDTKHGFQVEPRLNGLYRRAATRPIPVVDYVLGKATVGLAPPALTGITGEGYVVLRPERTFATPEEWANQPVLFIDYGDKPRSHGHHDALSFLAYFEGEAVLIDGAGPYAYMPAVRPYVAARSRGNSVVVDGYEEVDRSATIEQVYDTPELTGATGALEQQGVVTSRTIVWLDSRVLIAIDQMTPDDRSSHHYALYHHFPPESEIAVEDERFRIRTPLGLNVIQETFAPAPADRAVHEAAATDEFAGSRGWVVTGFNEARPAPVSEVSMTAAGDTWMVTVFSTSASQIQGETMVSASDASLILSVGDRSLRYSFERRALSEGRRTAP